MVGIILVLVQKLDIDLLTDDHTLGALLDAGTSYTTAGNAHITCLETCYSMLIRCFDVQCNSMFHSVMSGFLCI